MNQFVLFHFSIAKNDRIYQFIIPPGSPWQDIEEVFDEFRGKFADLKIEAQKKEQEQAAATAAE